MCAPEDGGPEEDAIRIADDSAYGLSGSVTSGSLDRALGIARHIRTGTFGVNGGSYFAVGAPFGGYKQSGVGRVGGFGKSAYSPVRRTSGYDSRRVRLRLG
jgi:aldehyde dehydrogenase (NAD+)